MLSFKAKSSLKMPILGESQYLKPWIVPTTHPTEKPQAKNVKMNETLPVDRTMQSKWLLIHSNRVK